MKITGVPLELVKAKSALGVPGTLYPSVISLYTFPPTLMSAEPNSFNCFNKPANASNSIRTVASPCCSIGLTNKIVPSLARH